jgi:hypothetical protein
MICVDVLALWGCLAVISFVTDSIDMYLSLTGRLGDESLAMTQRTAARAGGVRRWVLVSLASDIFTPWLMWQGMLASYFDDGMD